MFKDEIPANREQSKQQHFKVVATLSNFFSLPFFLSAAAPAARPFLRHLYWHLAARAPIRTKGFPHTHPRPSPPCVRQFCLFGFSFLLFFGHFRVGRPGPADMAKGYWDGNAKWLPEGDPPLITQRLLKHPIFTVSIYYFYTFILWHKWGKFLLKKNNTVLMVQVHIVYFLNIAYFDCIRKLNVLRYSLEA